MTLHTIDVRLGKKNTYARWIVLTKEGPGDGNRYGQTVWMNISAPILALEMYVISKD
ncbi:MAG: hypothetical protein ACI9P5_001684 [Saprospiraceae bacterium]|jgi:hypothetical protein